MRSPAWLNRFRRITSRIAASTAQYLNDLVAARWLYALGSVLATRPTKGVGATLTLCTAHFTAAAAHGQLIRFTKAGGRCRPLRAWARCWPAQLRAARVSASSFRPVLRSARRLRRAGAGAAALVVGDARRLAEYAGDSGTVRLLLTDPPYAQMMAKPKPASAKAGRADATPFWPSRPIRAI
jgi:hypothetical protein